MLKVLDFYEPTTGSFTYLIYHSDYRQAVVIDPVLDYDPVSGHISTEAVDPVILALEKHNLELRYILETHAHADHLTAAKQLQQRFQAEIMIGDGIRQIQETFLAIYGQMAPFDATGDQFDHLLKSGDCIALEGFEIEVLATPGHTRDSLTYKIDNYLFIGDTLFHPTIGSGRCDFPGGDAGLLFDSINLLLNQDDASIFCLCHDYPGEDRAAETFISMAAMLDNIHWRQCAGDKQAFIKTREGRDAQLKLPRLIIPAIQVNCRAGIKEQDYAQPLLWPINRF